MILYPSKGGFFYVYSFYGFHFMDCIDRSRTDLQ
jgi:hypothetical protein